MNKYILLLIIAFFSWQTSSAQDVLPLLHTQWGQRMPFNQLCPVDSASGEKMLAGCGPIAMAQIIRSLQYPATSPSGDSYEWSLMPHQPLTAQDGMAVSKLVADCGVNAFTSYGRESSSTQTQNMVNAMKKRFGYNPYVAIVKRELYQGDEGRRLWRDLVFGELRAGRPVIARGQKADDGRSGHLFVIDGIRDTMVHVNFGWYGNSDGYYSLDDLGGYSVKQRIAIGIGAADYVPAIYDVTTERAGLLAELLPQDKWPQIHHLRIKGMLNEDDFKLLRLMAQEDTIGGRHGFLHSVDLYDTSVAYLPDSAFKNTQSLVYIRLPKALQQIGRGAFSCCTGLNEVEIPPTVWRIRGGAFWDCFNLLDIHIPEGVHNVLSRTFYRCSNLTEVTLPATIDTLGAGVFEGCRRLERVTIPAATRHIGVGVFNRCPNLQEVVIDPANKEFAYSAGQLVGLTTRAKEQLGQLQRSKPVSLGKIPAQRVRKVKMVKRNGKWVKVK